MDEEAKRIYHEALQEGEEKVYNFDVMFVGHGGVGKTTLIKRLLKLPVKIKEYTPTNGVEIHIHQNEVNIATGIWGRCILIITLDVIKINLCAHPLNHNLIL